MIHNHVRVIRASVDNMNSNNNTNEQSLWSM